MRLKLEQLKVMDDEQLAAHWDRGGFPFEGARGCGACLTGHAIKNSLCGEKHEALSAQVAALGDIGPRADNMQFVRKHLEQLYALRLFYDSLYPQPAESESNAVAAKQESGELVAKQ